MDKFFNSMNGNQLILFWFVIGLMISRPLWLLAMVLFREFIAEPVKHFIWSVVLKDHRLEEEVHNMKIRLWYSSSTLPDTLNTMTDRVTAIERKLRTGEDEGVK